MIGIGIGLNYGNPVSSAVAAWTPASLTGLLFQIEADTAKLWKDTAGTLAVTADGDTVQRIDSKFGTTFFTILTGTCTYKTGAGKPYLDFAACAFRLSGSAVVVTDGSGQHSSGVSAYFNALGSTQVVWDLDNTATTRLAITLWIDAAGVSNTIAFNTVPTSFQDSAGSVSATTPATLIEVTTTSATEVFKDNVGNGSTAITGTLQSGAVIPAVGGNNYASPGFLFSGRLYSLVHATGTINSTERGNLHIYLASKHP